MKIKEYVYSASNICSRCVIDDTVPGISFNREGVCPLCHIHDRLEEKYSLNQTTTAKLKRLIDKIKKDGKGKKYDCILGASGGRDSTFTLYNAVKLGLRPLVVHFDNGWNSEIAVQNIKNACQKLNVDLYTHVADWEEFKDLQRSFLLASVPDAEVPTDWVIFSVLFQAAARENVKYIIHGHSFRTEGTAPLTWTYMDGKYVHDIQNNFGTLKIKSFPIMTMFDYLYFSFIRKIQQVRILYYIPYDEQEVFRVLEDELNWQNYGDKHHESKYTAFFQAYILTRKFNIDKRKLHCSALIRSNQITRAEALEILRKDPYDGGEELLDYCLKKLDFQYSEFEKIMSAPIKSFRDYKSYYPIMKKFKKPIKWATRLNLIPDTVYLKYFAFFK